MVILVLTVSLHWVFPSLTMKFHNSGAVPHTFCCRKSQETQCSCPETIIAENEWKPKLLSKKKTLLHCLFCFPPGDFSRCDVWWRSILIAQLCFGCYSEICAICSCSKTWKCVSWYIKTRWFSLTVIAKSRSGIPIYENRVGTDDAPVTISEACIELTLHPVKQHGWKNAS